MINLVNLKNEIRGDPLGRGYAAIGANTSTGDEALANRLNIVDRTKTLKSITTADLYDAIVPAEYDSRSASQKAQLSDILALNEVRVQGRTRDVLLVIFAGAGGASTRQNLSTLITVPGARWEELGLADRPITPSDVADCNWRNP